MDGANETRKNERKKEERISLYQFQSDGKVSSKIECQTFLATSPFALEIPRFQRSSLNKILPLAYRGTNRREFFHSTHNLSIPHTRTRQHTTTSHPLQKGWLACEPTLDNLFLLPPLCVTIRSSAVYVSAEYRVTKSGSLRGPIARREGREMRVRFARAFACEAWKIEEERRRRRRTQRE